MEAQQYSMSSPPRRPLAQARSAFAENKSRHRDRLFGAHHLPV